MPSINAINLTDDVGNITSDASNMRISLLHLFNNQILIMQMLYVDKGTHKCTPRCRSILEMKK